MTQNQTISNEELDRYKMVLELVENVLAKTLGPKESWIVMSHLAWKLKGKYPYIEDFNSTLSRHFLEDIDPIKKQNWGGLVGSHNDNIG